MADVTSIMDGLLDSHHERLGLDNADAQDVRMWHLLVSVVVWCEDHKIDLGATLTDVRDYVSTI